MHILHLTPYYAPAYAFGGVPRAVEGMALALVQAGHQVSILTTDAYDRVGTRLMPLQEQRQGVTIWRVPNRLPLLRRLNLSTPLGLPALLKQRLQASPPDVVHIHEFRTLEALLATPMFHQWGIPIVLSPHGTLAPSTGRSTLKTLWDRLLSPSVARRIDHIIALSEREAQDARTLWHTFGAPSRLSIIPNGVDASAFEGLPDPASLRARYAWDEQMPVVLFMGRLQARKGVQILCDAFHSLAEEFPQARLLLVGPDEGMAHALAPYLNDERQRIVWAGYLEGTERLQALACADVFALPAVGEGLPMAALEALAAGIPALLSPECALPQVAQAGAGWIVAPEREALRAALRSALSLSPVQQATMRHAARTLVRQSFSWQGVAQALLAVYTDCIKPQAVVET